MIISITPFFSGNAIKVLLSPPATAVRWRIARNVTGGFPDEHTDTVYAGDNVVFIDHGLVNNQTYFWQAFYFDGRVWSVSGYMPVAVSPAITYTVVNNDPLSVVRERLDAGLNGLLAQGKLTHTNGRFPVLVAWPRVEDARFPLVTVHLESEIPDERFIGDMVADDADITGWYSKTTLHIVSCTLNGDERLLLRRAIKNVLLANLDFFDALGLIEISFSQADTEDMERFQSPLYLTNTVFTCTAQAAIQAPPPGVINSFDVIATPLFR